MKKGGNSNKVTLVATFSHHYITISMFEEASKKR